MNPTFRVHLVPQGMPQILIWCGLLEVLGLFAYVNMREGKTDRKPGDFGLRGFYPSDAKGPELSCGSS